MLNYFVAGRMSGAVKISHNGEVKDKTWDDCQYIVEDGLMESTNQNTFGLFKIL